VWLERMSGAIQASDPGRLITVALHMESSSPIGPGSFPASIDVIARAQLSSNP